jgi:acetyl-CoA carboxylase/biotin carboxylase 1
MLKASEGGGGKGIRMSKDAAELRNNFVQVTNEVPGARRRPFRRGACSQQQTHARTTRRLAHVPHAAL